MKRMRVAAEPEIERCLLQWLRRVRAENVPISGPLLQQKAQDFACQLGKVELKCSNSWLDRFKNWHELVCDYDDLSEITPVPTPKTSNNQGNLCKIHFGREAKNHVLAQKKNTAVPPKLQKCLYLL
uniref:HTH CENPB-type domain-containing protein n=1 Tax=Romanomermis culicivorax TaxID=13658 RepID=A0A915IT95_ROMCU